MPKYSRCKKKKSLTQEVKTLKKQVYSHRPEVKYVDNNFLKETFTEIETRISDPLICEVETDSTPSSGLGINREGFLTRVTYLPQGVLAYERIGTDVKIVAVQAKAVFSLLQDPSSAGADDSCLVRCVMVRDNAPDGADKAKLSGIFTVLAGSSAPLISAYRNLGSHKSRYTVLYDKTKQIDLSSHNRAVFSHNIYIKNPKSTSYSNNSNLPGSGPDYYVGAWYDGELASMTLEGTVRTKYIDN